MNTTSQRVYNIKARRHQYQSIAAVHKPFTTATLHYLIAVGLLSLLLCFAAVFARACYCALRGWLLLLMMMSETTTRSLNFQPAGSVVATAQRSAAAHQGNDSADNKAFPMVYCMLLIL